MSPSCSKDYTTEEDNPLDAIDTDVEDSPVVRLIQAARLPSRHVKLVRARVLDPQARSVRVFEPEKEAWKEKGLVIEDAVVEPDEDRYVTLAIHNCSLHTVRLEGITSLDASRKSPYCQHRLLLKIDQMSGTGGCGWPGSSKSRPEIGSHGMAGAHLQGSEKKKWHPPNINAAQQELNN